MKIPSTDKVVKEIVKVITKLRYKKHWSMGNINQYLEDKYGLNRTRRWELINLAKKAMADYQKVDGHELEDAIEALENMRQSCVENKDYKTAFNIQKEIDDMKGLKIKKLEIEGNLLIERPFFDLSELKKKLDED